MISLDHAAQGLKKTFINLKSIKEVKFEAVPGVGLHLDEVGLASGVDHLEGVRAVAVHVPASRKRTDQLFGSQSYDRFTTQRVA
jgi:hypothetical protein